MRKVLFAAVLVLCAASISHAQATIAVSASHIQGLNGANLVSGSLCFQATDANNINIGIQVSGGGTVVSTPFCQAVSNGAIAGFNVPNPATATPLNARYRITITQGSRTVGIFLGTYLCNLSGACTTPYTFNFDNCLSRGACIANPIPIATGPVGPKGATGATGPTGPTGALSSNTGITVGGNAILKGSDPHRDVMAYGASGSLQTTTTSGSFTSGSTSLPITSALDFVNGQGVRIVGAGSASVLTVPTGVAVTPEGTAGSTTYTYQVSCVDAKWGVTAASSAASTTTGNATLTYGNFNQIGWTADAGCVYYAVWRTTPAAQFEGITPNLFWYDYGREAMVVPSTIPSTPPVSAQIGFYYGIIVSGAGTTTLTMDTASGTTAIGRTLVEHDDSAAIQASMNAATLPVTGFASGTQDVIYLAAGNSNVTQPLVPNANIFMTFQGAGKRIASQLIAHVPGMDLFLIKNSFDSLSFRDFGIQQGASSTAIRVTQSAAALSHLELNNLRMSGESGSATSGETTGVRLDNNIIILNMTNNTIAEDVDLRFGEPGFPIQLDDIHLQNNDFYSSPVNTANAGTFQFVGLGDTTLIDFTHNLIEGPVPTGSLAPWFRISSVLLMTFNGVEFAAESFLGSGATFQAWPGLPVGGEIVFNQSPVGQIGTGGVFDFSAGSGQGPFVVLNDSNASASGGSQVFHAGKDMSAGLSCNHSKFTPTQTLFSGNGNITAMHCAGLAGFTDGSIIFYGRELTGADQDIFALDDNSGNPLFHVDPAGITRGQAFRCPETTAPSGTSGFDYLYCDSTAHAWKMIDNNGSPVTVAGVAPVPLEVGAGANVVTAPNGFFVCTGICTVTPPLPTAGVQFCVMNDDNVATVITMGALGGSGQYENTARTGYGTAGTGTVTSGGTAGDKLCIIGRDATHYLTVSFNGTWTAH
jgi:hypothetical protein